MTELTKKDKKVARELIEKGLQIEFEKCLTSADVVLSEWKSKMNDNKTSYYSLYKQIMNFDKHIGRRYDRMTGSNYIFIILELLADDVLNVNDLKGFSTEVQEYLIKIQEL